MNFRSSYHPAYVKMKGYIESVESDHLCEITFDQGSKEL